MNFTKKEIDFLVKEVKQTLPYKRLMKRTFRKHKDYPTWSLISHYLALQFFGIQNALAYSRFDDFVWSECTHSYFRLWNQQQTFPVFALDKQLLKAFQETEIPEQFIGLPRPFEKAIVIFPDNAIKNPANQTMDFVCVDFVDNEVVYNPVYFEYIKKECGVNLLKSPHNHYSGANLMRWCSTVGIDNYSSSHHIPKDLNESIIESQLRLDDTAEIQFINQVTSIVYLFLLYISSQDQTVLENESTDFAAKRVKRCDPKLPLNYRIVGEGYKTKRIYTNKSGSHASPVMHERRGHIRTLSTNKQVWVRPCLVNAN